MIFDVDGTLVDSQHHIIEAQTRAFAAHRLAAPTRQKSLSVVGLSLSEAFTALVGPDGPVLSLAEAYKDAWTAMRGEGGFAETLYPDASETIAHYARISDVLLGIATGKSRRGVDRLIDAQGWTNVFVTIQTADEQPHPSMLTRCLTETGIPAEKAIMVGDTTFDMAMAIAAGVHPLGVAWGYHEPDALLAGGAEAVMDDFAALRAFLDGFTGEKAAP